MDVAWPAVEPGLLSFLQRIFVTPLRLDAAFDGEIDCEEGYSQPFLTWLMRRGGMPLQF